MRRNLVILAALGVLLAGVAAVILVINQPEQSTEVSVQPLPVPPTAPSNVASAVSPTTTAATSCSGLQVRPGANLGSLAASNPEGTVFCLGAGTYRGQVISPRHEQQFIGVGQVILDGEGIAAPAFRADGTTEVVIRGLEITAYCPPLDSRIAVIHSWTGTYGWTVENNHIHHNCEIGVRISRDWVLRNNIISYNGRYGVTGVNVNGRVEGNEIAYNNTDHGPGSGDAGGTKFVHTERLTVVNNWVHHNNGNGLWTDGNNLDTLYENNRVEFNARSGIFVEISCRTWIRNNYLEGNGTSPNLDWLDQPLSGNGIAVNTSRDVEVSHNVLIGNHKGIGAAHFPQHTGLDSVNKCAGELANFHAHDNETASDTMAASLGGRPGTDNRFTNNLYHIGPNARFRLFNRWLSFEQWQAAGHQ